MKTDRLLLIVLVLCISLGIWAAASPFDERNLEPITVEVVTVRDTIFVHDTVYVTQHDTIFHHDVVFLNTAPTLPVSGVFPNAYQGNSSKWDVQPYINVGYFFGEKNAVAASLGIDTPIVIGHNMFLIPYAQIGYYKDTGVRLYTGIRYKYSIFGAINKKK